MSCAKFSDDFKRDAVAEHRAGHREVAERLGVSHLEEEVREQAPQQDRDPCSRPCCVKALKAEFPLSPVDVS